MTQRQVAVMEGDVQKRRVPLPPKEEVTGQLSTVPQYSYQAGLERKGTGKPRRLISQLFVMGIPLLSLGLSWNHYLRAGVSPDNLAILIFFGFLGLFLGLLKSWALKRILVNFMVIACNCILLLQMLLRGAHAGEGENVLLVLLFILLVNSWPAFTIHVFYQVGFWIRQLLRRFWQRIKPAIVYQDPWD